MSRVGTIREHVLRRHGCFKINFYRVHVFYFLSTILLSSVIVYGSGVNGNTANAEAKFKLRYIDAFFLCASAMTNTGLNTVNLHSLTGFQQVVLCVLILMGNVTITTNAAVWIRRYFLRRHMKEFLQHSKAARERVEDIDAEERGSRVASLATGAIHSVSSGIRKIPGGAGLHKLRTTTTRKLRRHHELGQGGLPYPWQWEISRKLGSKLVAPAHSIQRRLHPYLSFQPSFDRKVWRLSYLGGTFWRSDL